MFKNAKYRGIPCWYNEDIDELEGKNWLYNILIDINIWFDFNVLLLEELPIWVDVNDNEL